MAMIIQCPNTTCTASFTVAESISGRRVKCKKCGTHFTAQKTIDGQTNDTQKSNPIASGQQITSRALPFEFGRYRMLKKLGQGGMGAVFLAEDTKLARSVAIKLPFFEPEKSSKRVERFLREAQSLAILKHPNICSVFDVGEIEGQPFIVMEFIEGKSLEELIDPDSPMPELQAVKYVRKLANALAHAHAKGIIHRDLKPANVIISRDDEPILLDFGLAMRENLTDPNESRLTQTGAVMGTPCYMAPEQVRGELDKIGPSTDVYALGIMLFELLTGKTPYSGPMGIVMAQILSANVPKASEFRKGIDARLDSLCFSAMSKESAQRPVGMKELEQELLGIEQYTGETISNIVHFQSAFETETWRHESEFPADEIPSKTASTQSDETKDSKAKSKPDLTQEVGSKENTKKSGALFKGYQRLIKAPLALRIGVPLLILLSTIAAIYMSSRQGSGIVVFKVTPPDAVVEYRIDGIVTDLASRNFQINLRAGEHGLAVDSGQFESVREQFNVKAGKTTEVTILLQSNSKALDGSKVGPDLEPRKPEESPKPSDGSKADVVVKPGQANEEPAPKKVDPTIKSNGKEPEKLPTYQLVIEELYNKMMASEPKDLISAIELLRPYSKEIVGRFSAVINDKDSASKSVLRAGAVLSVLSPEDPRWADGFSLRVVEAFARLDMPELIQWSVALKPSRNFLLPHLQDFLLEDRWSKRDRLKLSKVYGILSDIDAKNQEELDSHFADYDTKPGLDLNLRKARIILTIMRSSNRSADPALSILMIDRFNELRINSQFLISLLEIETKASVRRWLIQALAEYPYQDFTSAEKVSYQSTILKIFKRDYDAGVHSSAVLLMKKWGMEKELIFANENMRERNFSKDYRWYVNGQGLTMVMVGKLGEADIVEDRTARIPRIEDYTFSISSTEVSVGQFQKFTKDKQLEFKYDKIVSSNVDSPICSVSWFRAAEYCNWLSMKEGIPKDQWCYLPNDMNIYGPGMTAANDFLKLTGYRLPTELEWEVSCRAGTSTLYSFGNSQKLHSKYAWVSPGTDRESDFKNTARIGRLRPNDLGIFDMHGNLWEWCQDTYSYVPNAKLVDLVPVGNSLMKAVRGGAYNCELSKMTSSYRVPRYPYDVSGLTVRPVRTYKP